MLDDLKYLHEKDPDDTLGIAERQCGQLLQDFDLSGADFGTVKNIVYGGMGGSALAALFLKTWPLLDRPFELVRDYDIPAYVDSDTLFIASSYSGNTEETLSALSQAEAKGARIAIIASGGKLQEIAAEKKYPFTLIPKAEQPRYAVFSNFKAILAILDKAGVIRLDDLKPDIKKAHDFLQASVRSWTATIPTNHNPAKQLAQELLGTSVVVYAGPKMWPVGYKWKIGVNENAKHIAWFGQLPEFNHNEFIGWSKQPIDKPYSVIDLRSHLEHPRVQKRFVVSERLLSGMRPSPLVVEVQGDTLLEQLVWGVAFGDFVSLYLGILNGVNPAPVELVEKLKKALNQ